MPAVPADHVHVGERGELDVGGGGKEGVQVGAGRGG